MTDAGNREKLAFAHVKAANITPLKAFQKYAADDPHHVPMFCDGSICIEPCSAGGALIIAVTGHAMAILHDPDGYASEPVRLAIPDEAFEAGKAAHWAYTFEGQEYEVPLPEWCQPGHAYFYDPGMHIAPRMRPPVWAEEQDAFFPALFTASAPPKQMGTVFGKDYRLTKGTLPWRQLMGKLRNAPPHPADTIHFNPHVANLFEDIFTLLASRHEFGTITHRLVSDPKGNAVSIVTMRGAPEFVGTYMHMKPAAAPDLPAHFFAPAATHEAPDQKQ